MKNPRRNHLGRELIPTDDIHHEPEFIGKLSQQKNITRFEEGIISAAHNLACYHETHRYVVGI
jgi:hypothetical protein